MTLLYKISDTGEHTFISANGRLLAVVGAKRIRDEAEKSSASDEWAQFFEKYGILATMLGNGFDEEQEEKAIDFFREFCWLKKERGKECAVALKRCPLFDICRGNKGFWEDVEKIEVNGGWDDAKNG